MCQYTYKDEFCDVRETEDEYIGSDVSDDENRDLPTRADRPVFKPTLTPNLGSLRDEAMDPEGMVRRHQEYPHPVPPGGARSARGKDAQVLVGNDTDTRQQRARADGQGGPRRRRIDNSLHQSSVEAERGKVSEQAGG